MKDFLNNKSDFWLKNSNYVDVRKGLLVENANIRVTDGVITEITDSIRDNEENVVDCSGLYLVPGLIDMHVHIVWDGGENPVRTMLDDGDYVNVLRGLTSSQNSLKQGVTTLRDVGSPDDIAIDLAFAIDRGIVDGPTLIPCGRILQCTGGHVPEIGLIADTDDEIKKAIRYLKSRDVKWIKIAATGGAYGPEEIGPVLFSEEELKLIVREAHRLNMKVAAHALSEVGINGCIEAGIDTIEHGAHIEEEGLKKMVEKDLAFIPTLKVYMELAEGDDKLPANIVEKAKIVTENQKKTFKKAMELGVKIALGTDAGSPGFGSHPSVLKEMIAMRDYGMSNIDVIKSATINGAEVLENDKIGVIEVGRNADIVILDENPVEDLNAFKNILYVFKDGKLV